MAYLSIEDIALIKQPAKGGVYIIKCLVNGKMYCGSTSDFNGRYKQHYYDLRAGRHFNKILLDDYNRFGETLFEFVILRRIKKHSKRRVLENRIISRLMRCGVAYNLKKSW